MNGYREKKEKQQDDWDLRESHPSVELYSLIEKTDTRRSIIWRGILE
jgi:hypothetical protein